MAKRNGKGLIASALIAFAALLPGLLVPDRAEAADRPALKLWRLDCGTIEIGNLDEYSDTFAYPGRSMTFTDSCYLVRNGDRYLLWDTGLPKTLEGKEEESGTDRMSLKASIVRQLAQLGIEPEQVTFIGISHYHYDHTGQAADFSGATLLVDRADWDVINKREDLSANFGPWIGGNGTVQTLTYDHDVFGDGTVMMLKAPGHTPGHRSLLVRLKDRGPILLSGDAVHFRENWSREGVPGFNTSRAETLASIGRLGEIAAQIGATLVIQHEPADIAKLAPFPEPSH